MANNYDDEFFGFEGIDDDDFLEDDKIDRVLDEIAEIKQTIQGLPDAGVVSGGSGYDEVTKLRDEVKFSKTTQKLQSEIRRLSNRINDLQDDRMGAEAKTDELLGGTVERLTALGEELIRRNKESERRIADELAALKRQLYKLTPSGDISGALNTIKNNLKTSEEFIININNAVENLAVSGTAPSSAYGSDTELLRQFYDVKNLLGNPSSIGEKRNDELLALYDMLDKVRYDVRLKSMSVAEKFASVDALACRLNETGECDITPVAQALNFVIDELSDQPLDDASVSAIFEFSDSGKLFSIPNSKREAVRSYLDSVSALTRDGGVENLDELPDIIALKNSIQGNKNEFECESIYSAILNTNIALLGEKDILKQKSLRQELKKQIKRLTSLEVRDLVNYPHVSVSKPYRAQKRVESEGLFDKLNELKNFLLDANLAQSGGIVAQPVNGGLVSEINNLKNEIYNLSNMDNVSQAILDLKSDCLTIIEKLDERPSSEEDGIIANIPTLSEIVTQLDRLFDDVKNLAADSENNVLGSVEVIGEAVARLSEDSKASSESARSDRLKLLEDVAFIRAAVEKKSLAVVPVAAPVDPDVSQSAAEDAPMSDEAAGVDESVLSDNRQDGDIVNNTASANGNNDIYMRLEAIEKNQQLLLEAVNTLSSRFAAAPALPESVSNGERDDKIIDEVRLLRDQLFAVTMANVSDGETSSYESYSKVILDEIYALQDKLDELSGKFAAGGKLEADKVSEELASLKAELASALNRSGDNEEIIKELNKIKEEFHRRPQPPVRQKQPEASKPVVIPPKKKTVTPMINKDLSINEILMKISQTDIVLKED